MAELITDYSVERDALLYVVSENGKPKGWRIDLLAEKLAESEEKLLSCSCCNGLLRDACLYEEELRCGVCIPEGVAWQPVKKIRNIVNQKMVICLLGLLICRLDFSLRNITRNDQKEIAFSQTLITTNILLLRKIIVL